MPYLAGNEAELERLSFSGEIAVLRTLVQLSSLRRGEILMVWYCGVLMIAEIDLLSFLCILFVLSWNSNANVWDFAIFPKPAPSISNRRRWNPATASLCASHSWPATRCLRVRPLSSSNLICPWKWVRFHFALHWHQIRRYFAKNNLNLRCSHNEGCFVHASSSSVHCPCTCPGMFVKITCVSKMREIHSLFYALEFMGYGSSMALQMHFAAVVEVFKLRICSLMLSWKQSFPCFCLPIPLNFSLFCYLSFDLKIEHFERFFLACFVHLFISFLLYAYSQRLSRRFSNQGYG